MAKLFTNATLVLADRLLPGGWLLEEDGKIAEALGKSEKSVANAVFRIRSKLRALLEK